jgi:folylpolyglutamate synthase/dihydropteroate synthase
MEQARQFAASDDRILVTGSFYLVGPVLKALEIYSTGGGDT